MSRIAPTILRSLNTTTAAVRARATPEFLSHIPNTPSSPFPKEYSHSQMVTETPGPKSLAAKERMSRIQDIGAVHFFVDYEASRGNYIVDVDGNRYLDVYGQIASLPIGYNHPNMIKAMSDPKNASMLAQRPCLGVLPPADWTERVVNTLATVAPKGLSEISTMMCGSCSNENAFKAVFIWYQTRLRGGLPPTTEEMDSCMTNSAPGCPDLSILSFSGGFHGRLMGCMSATHSKAIHKVDIPAFDWPVASYPKLKYPLEEHVAENDVEEARCLAEVEDIIIKMKQKQPVAGMVVEPIQAEGGDNHASPAFFRALREISTKHGVAFIVDEVQTGGGSTGTFWAHEQWGLENNPPDIVTFSKKMQTGGYFAKPEFRPNESYRIFNTWMGDPTKIIQLQAFLDTVEEENLLENTRITGEYLRNGLKEIQSNNPFLLSNVRGVGTYNAVDLPTPAIRDSVISKLRQLGVESGGCGDNSIRFRPALVFQPKHAAEFLEIFEDVCSSTEY